MKSKFKVIVNDAYPAAVDFIQFPGGEYHVKVGMPVAVPDNCNILIIAEIREGEIMPLALLKDAVDRRYPRSKVSLYLEYVPYARQDRVPCKGEAHSLKVFCTFINSLNFAEVTVEDPHSYVVEALLDRVTVVDQLVCLIRAMTKEQMKFYDCVVAPDIGAVKKAEKAAQHMGVPLLVGQKTRNPVTGQIRYAGVSAASQGNIAPTTALIVDDICDGGMTFTLCAKALREAYPETLKVVDLFVTHGIFSKGPKIEGIDNSFAYNNWSK